MKLNLHAHTKWSDGYLSFQELLKYAKEQGLTYLGIGDHDRTKAWGIQNINENRPYISGGIDSSSHGLLHSEGLKILQGIELSANDGGEEVHILGLYIDQPDQEFNVYLEAIEKYRWLRAGVIAEKLDISLERVMKEVSVGIPSRLHFGYIKFLEEMGKDESERDPKITCARDAMKKHVGPQTEGYVSFEVDFIYTPQKAIERIFRLGGIPIWAHSKRTCERTGLPLEKTFERYKEYARGKPFGMEVEYPGELEAMMEKYSIVIVGNDFHGYPYEPEEKSLVVEVPNELGAELITRLEKAKEEIINLIRQ